MSYAMAEFSDGSYEYYENVSLSWGDLGITLDGEEGNYYYINPVYLVKMQVSDEPLYHIEFEFDEEEEDSEDE